MKDTEAILFLGCIHQGFEYADLAYSQAYIDWAKKTGASVMVLSDNFECALPHRGKGMSFSQNKQPQQQLDDTIEMFKPIAKQIIGYCSGNHASRAYEVAGIDLDKTVVDNLRIAKVYRPEHGLISFKAGSQTYTISFTHGADCGVDVFRNHRKLLAMYPGSDICASSHSHVCATTKQAYWAMDREGRPKLREIAFISTGSNLNYPKYAGKALYPPQPKGYAIAQLGTKDRSVSVDVSGIVPCI